MYDIEEMCYKDDVKDLCTQSETFGKGVFSDPIEQAQDQKQRILRNFDSLVPGGTSNDFAKTWIVAHLFDELEQAFDKANYSNKALLDGISKGEGFALADTHWPDNRSVKSTNINRCLQTMQGRYVFGCWIKPNIIQRMPEMYWWEIFQRNWCYVRR